MPTEHSRIGFSAGERTLECPGWVRVSDGIVSAESEYAREGTAAHALIEECFKTHRNSDAFLGGWIDADLNIRDAKPNTEGAIEITQGMVEATQTMLDTVRKDRERGDRLEVEVGFHLGVLHEDLWGTSDAVLYKPLKRKLVVYDYKHGAGIAVDVDENQQLLGYACGAVFGQWTGKIKPDLRIDTVEIVIVQPRAHHGGGMVRRWETEALALLDWADKYAKGAARTQDPDAPLALGDWCRWCPGAAICPEQIEKVQETMPEVPKTQTYDPQLLADGLGWIPLAKARIKAIETFAQSEAVIRGIKIPGYKVVAGEGIRAWVDTTAALKKLLENGYDMAVVQTPPKGPEILSVAQLEEIVGKKTFGELLSDLVAKPDTGPKLVKASDKRPELKRDVASGFEPVTKTEDDPFA